MPSDQAQAAPAAAPDPAPDAAAACLQMRAAARTVLDGVPLTLLRVAADGQVWVNAAAHRQLGEQASTRLQAWLEQTAVAAALLQSSNCTSDLQLPVGMSVDWVHASSQPDGEGGWTISLQAIDAQPSAKSRPVMQGAAEHQVTPFLGAAIETTGRTEPDLRSTSERAALAAHSAGLGTWEVDLLDGSTHWDAQMWLLRGRPPESRAMDPDERLACVHPDDLEAIRDLHTRDLGQQLSAETAFRVVWPDGQLRWLATRSQVLVDEHGQPSRRIGVNWDVTAARTAEAVRQEREVARRESAAMSQFMARMSHELRTPLNAVLGFTQLLLADEAGEDARAMSRRRRLNHIQSAGSHLLTLINDVLDLASLESGELRIALQPVALAPLVLGTVPMLGPLVDAHGVQIRTETLDGHVMADATRLRQVLLNLLSNAVKYNRPGGQVWVTAQREGDLLVIEVADNGRGMDAIQMRQLFEPFNRLGMAGAAIEGSGIGLSIAKTLAERMGGSLRARSTPGQGSVFELRLQLPVGVAASAAADSGAQQKQQKQQKELAAPPAELDPPRRQLLYIEDNPVNAMIISELLGRRQDLELAIAIDGISGVQHAQQLLPELILLDMQLPDIDGLEVMRRLQADVRTAHIPCIALSANAMPEDIERALEGGAADYWTKPLDFRAFMAGLDTLFGKSTS